MIFSVFIKLVLQFLKFRGKGEWSVVEGVGCNIIGLSVKIFCFSQINCVCLDDAGARCADYISHSLTVKISGFFP